MTSSIPQGPTDPWTPNAGTPAPGTPPPDQSPYGQYPPAPRYGPPPYGQPPNPYAGGPYGYPSPPGNPYPPTNPGFNGFAIAGFVCAFLCSLLGIIFSAIALNQISTRGERGRGLAIAGLVIGIISIIISVIVIAAGK